MTSEEFEALTESQKAQVRRALSLVGSVKTAKKAKSSRENGVLGGRPLKPLSEIDCTCRKCPDDPKSYCPRGRAILRRQKNGQPLD